VNACRWHACADSEPLYRSATDLILAAAAQSINVHGSFHLVLAGGNTPRELYQRLAMAHADWHAWHLYFSDERCLPPDDPGRNSNMARDAWLAHVPIPPQHIHAIPAELGASTAAERYTATLSDVGTFDLVLLGLGEDGHTASLFPGHVWGIEPDSEATLAVFDAPKPPAERVSMSAARLSRARQVLFLVSGKAKRQAVAAWRAGEDIPARAIRPAGGVDVLIEATLFQPEER